MRRLPLVAVSLLAVGALSACNSTQDVLEPSAIAAQQPALAPPPSQGDVTPAQPAAPPAPANSTTPAPAVQGGAVASNARIQFAPIVGTSVEAATALSERLASRARERGIALARSTDTTMTHVLKGYFTPLSEGKETTVIYVWDVYDPSGNRVHRITGQQKAPSGGSEGWSSVSSTTMQTIADSTIDQLVTWLTSRTG